uniref:Uncharacterized protein n=1 Tax=Panagrolaimus davidi TaxID=227884 RepID=A0A914R789_9BILA
MNAAERVFEKLFIACFDGHNEGVGILSKHALRLSHLLSAARDGQVKIWRLSNKKCLQTFQAHNGTVNVLTLLIREIINQLKWFTMIIQLQPHQKALHEYSERLRKQYQNHLLIGAIIKHRQAPKAKFHIVEP